MKRLIKPAVCAFILLLLGNALNAQQQDLATKTGSAVNTNTSTQAPVTVIPSGSGDIATALPVQSGATHAAPDVAVTEPKILHEGAVDAATGQKIIAAPVKAAPVTKTTGNVALKVSAEKAVYTEGPNKGKLIHPEAQQQTNVIPDAAKQAAEKAVVTKREQLNAAKATALTPEQRTTTEAQRKAEAEKLKKINY